MTMQPNINQPLTPDNQPDWIVVDDPLGEFSEGSLIGAARRAQLSARGVCTLPVPVAMMRQSGVGGYFRRGWGSGYPLSPVLPKLHCPILLFIEPPSARATQVHLHWRARVVSPADGPTPSGSLRIAVDTGQVNATHAHISRASAVDMGRLGPRDARGGWTVGGEELVNVPMRGHYGFGLYGAGPGMRVAWAAASVTLTSR
jgi:hypothetical protein